jgi:diguanylate cyclase (GGDEF)-like protein
MGLLKKLHSFIVKESRHEDEANGLLYLIRTVLVIWMPVYFIMGIFCIVAGLGYVPAALFLGGTVVYAGIFAETYTRRARRCLLYLIISATIITGFLTVVFGWRASFQNFIYINFLILWYDPTSDRRVKIISSVIMGISMCLISYLTPFGSTILTPNTLPHFVIVYANIILFSLCLSIVAYYFCNHYIETEHKLRMYNHKLKAMSETDPLTGLVNRRYVQEQMEELIKESRKEKYLFCIGIGDIDYFKNINDTYGHDAGDFILSELAKCFTEYTRDKGIVSRWGGEEFLFVLPRLNGDEALAFLDELRHMVKKKDFVFGGKTIKVTMTFGVEEFSEHTGVEKTIAEADKKLYIGKQSGRDRVVF